MKKIEKIIIGRKLALLAIRTAESAAGVASQWGFCQPKEPGCLQSVTKKQPGK